MSGRLPYFKWFPADAESDENYNSLTDSELGFFHRCLNRAWANGGSLPADPAARAKALQKSIRYSNKMWISVGKCFVFLEENPSRIINKRQWREYCDATEKSKKSLQAVEIREKLRIGRSSDDTSNDTSNDHPRARVRDDFDSDSVSDSGFSRRRLDSKNQEFINIDDDDEKPDRTIRFATELDELAELIASSTKLPAERSVLKTIDLKVSSNGQNLRGYIDDIRPRLRRLKKKPTPGFFISHAEGFGTAVQQRVKPARAEGPCPSCKFGTRPDGSGCPDCHTGQELIRYSRKAAAAKA